MKLFEIITIGKDTGNFRIIKSTQYIAGEEYVPRYEPQKEVKFLWIKYWEPITFSQYDSQGTFDSPYLVNSIKEAKDIIEKYKNETLDGSKTEVVYEERS